MEMTLRQSVLVLSQRTQRWRRRKKFAAVDAVAWCRRGPVPDPMERSAGEDEKKRKKRREVTESLKAVPGFNRPPRAPWNLDLPRGKYHQTGVQ